MAKLPSLKQLSTAFHRQTKFLPPHLYIFIFLIFFSFSRNQHSRTMTIHCQSIATFSESNPKNAIFFHRFDGGAMIICHLHQEAMTATKCLACEKKGSLAIYTPHYRKECVQDADKLHCWCHGTDHGIIDMISWFDEKIELVMPTHFDWTNSCVQSDEVLVPFGVDRYFSFNIQCASTKEIFSMHPLIQRQYLIDRSLVFLPYLNNPEKPTKNISGIGKFKVLTYNILSDLCAYNHTYWYCPLWAISWKYRKENILHELLSHDADILCLQEVQRDHFYNFFNPQLEQFGYASVYKHKRFGIYTGKDPKCDNSDGYTYEGCAIFFRKKMFEMVTSHEFEYRDSGLSSSLMEKVPSSQVAEVNRCLLQDNVGIILVLEMVGYDDESAVAFSRLCVANTHIFAKSRFPEVKLFQVSALISEIEKIIDQRMPLLICGDFNSYPGSDPYVLLTKQEVHPAHPEETDSLRIWLYQHLKLCHSRKLASAYATIGSRVTNMIDPQTLEPIFTRLIATLQSPDPAAEGLSYTSSKLTRGTTIDYLFFTEDSIEVEGLLELPDYKSVGRALPSPRFSSDHIALMGSFRITKPWPYDVHSHGQQHTKWLKSDCDPPSEVETVVGAIS